MSHQRYKQQLSPYLEGDLPPARRQRLERHLSECTACAEELRGLRGTRELLRGLPTPEPPPFLAERALARIEAGEVRPGAVARLGAWWRDLSSVAWPMPFAAVAAGLVAVAVVSGGDLPSLEGVEPGPDLRVAELAPPPEIPAPEVVIVNTPPKPPRAVPQARGRLTPRDPQRGFKVIRVMPAPALAPEVAPESSAGQLRIAQWTALASRDPQLFLTQLDSLPKPERTKVLDRVVSLAARSGTALRNAMQVQKLRHPLAPTVARAFERGAAER